MAAELNPSALCKRNKRHVATLMKQEWKKNKIQKLNEFLDYLLNPLNQFDNFETIDWCRFLVSGGETFEEFSKKVKQYDTAISCGLVWTADFVAYRCRTCGISPCMSLCNECFQAGNHEGHDYNMFRSQAGGACDCGDIFVMDPAGFCPRHGPSRECEAQSPPQDLLAMAEIMMPKLFQYFLLYLRDNWKPDMKGHSQNLMMADAEQYLGFLHSLSDMGAAMRHIITATLINPDLYPVVSSGQEGPHKAVFMDRCKNYLAAIQTSTLPKEFVRLHYKYGISTTLKHRTLLDELVFWMMKYEFPERIVTLLLGLLPDNNFKEAFVHAFIMHYTRISVVLVNALERAKVANRVLHISVQLFSNESLSCQMADQCRLLYIVVISLYYMVETCKIHCTMETEPDRQNHAGNFHHVVDCGSDVMKDHCYWPIISDVINLLQHRLVALKFMTDKVMVNLWMELLSFLQGMNINQRELVQHIQFEPDTYYAAFSAELEVSASPLWCLLAHCRTKETSRCIQMLIKEAKNNLEEWFLAVNLSENSKMHPFQLTFHLPLHRYLALAIMQAVKNQQVEFSVLPLDQDFLSKALIHVLQVQVGLTEILSGMWVRNGLQMKGQAMTYIQSHFSYSMADADIFLLQLCACKLDPDYFVNKVLEKFHIQNLLSSDWDNCQETVPLTLEQRLSMVEGALCLFVNLIDLQTYLGIEDKDLMRLEMVSLLCMADRQHSALQDQIPEKAGLNAQGKELFDPLLEEIADYKAPHFLTEGGLQQGTYVPKGFLWEQEFDPVHVLQRAIYRRDYQAAMDRYTEYLRRNRLYTKKSPPWPPFRAPRRVLSSYEHLFRILNCPAMHTFLFFVLHKSLEMFAQMPESILYNTIHLLDLALRFREAAESAPCCSQAKEPPAESTWLYHGNNLVENLCKVILEIPQVVPPSSSHGNRPHTVATDMEASSLEEMFMVAPSALISSSGPIVAAHSGVTPSYHSLSLSPQPGTSSSPSTSSQFKSRLVERNHEGGQHGPVQINESIVSLLMKLHAKLSEKGNTYVPLSMCNRKPSDSLYGDGPHFIGQLLDRLIMVSSRCEEYICQTHTTLHPKEEKLGKASSSKFLDAEERQRKARERQKKLLAQFASRQKAFMEKATQEGEGGSQEEEEPQDTCEDSLDGEQTYECVICNERTPSMPEDPIGLAVFLQATSILGHRQQLDPNWQQTLGEDRPKDFPSCAYVQSHNTDVLFNNFAEHSCQQSINIGWEGGVLVETCGHYLHLRCHHSYITSLRTQNYGNLAVQKGEYWCPVCRQLSNSVVPIVPEENKYSITVPVSQNVRQLVCDIGVTLMNRQSHAPSKSADSLNKAMADVMDDLTQATYTAFRKRCITESPESFLLFICSIARTNLELELLQRGGTIRESPAPVATKKLCFMPLMHVLSLHCHILNFHAPPNHVMWTHVTGVSFSPQSDSLTEYSKEVPLLLRDPTALLIQFVLTLPLSMATECFDLLVRMLHNIAYVQALCVASCSFAAEEREAWRTKGAKLPLDTMEGMLSFVIERMSLTPLYEDSMDSDQHPAISQSVWSPQSVQSLVEEHTLPYLRVAALLKQHLYGRISSKPSMVQIVTPRGLAGKARDSQTEYQFLCQSFGMEEGGNDVWKSSGRTGTPCPLTWAVPDARHVPRGWFDHLASFVNTRSSEAKMLMMSKPTWYPPCLVQLPREYYAIFEQFRQHTCPRCNTQPKEPALCLVCGQFLCFRDACCRDTSSIYECVQHSITCGAGTGIFLLVVSSIVVIIRGARAALWGCIHLDEHGEEDRDLKRGRPLYLSKERYDLLQSQWLAHSFDHTCKKWIWHRDRL